MSEPGCNVTAPARAVVMSRVSGYILASISEIEHPDVVCDTVRPCDEPCTVGMCVRAGD